MSMYRTAGQRVMALTCGLCYPAVGAMPPHSICHTGLKQIVMDEVQTAKTSNALLAKNLCRRGLGSRRQ